MTDKFDASNSAVGYIYQARYGLYLILQQDVGSKISFEVLDDVEIENNSGKQ